MKNRYILLVLFFSITFSTYGQKGAKIGYINMEYILSKLPEYQDAQRQLDDNVRAWKKEIDKKKNEIKKFKEELEAEKPLLTKELIEDSEEEIKFLESELFDYQQNIFGANGVMSNQKRNLIKPIQDEVFNAIQDIAEAKRYDFIFDKTADVVMLFASQRFDISDNVLRVMERAKKKQKMSKKQIKKLTAAEEKADVEAENNPELEARRQKAEETRKKKEDLLEERKKKREALLAERKALIEKRKKEKEEARQKALAEREAKKKEEDSTKTK